MVRVRDRGSRCVLFATGEKKGHESARGGVRGGRAKEDRMVKRKGRERERNIYIQPPVSFII